MLDQLAGAAFNLRTAAVWAACYAVAALVFVVGLKIFSAPSLSHEVRAHGRWLMDYAWIYTLFVSFLGVAMGLARWIVTLIPGAEPCSDPVGSLLAEATTLQCVIVAATGGLGLMGLLGSLGALVGPVATAALFPLLLLWGLAVSVYAAVAVFLAIFANPDLAPWLLMLGVFLMGVPRAGRGVGGVLVASVLMACLIGPYLPSWADAVASTTVSPSTLNPAPQPEDPSPEWWGGAPAPQGSARGLIGVLYFYVKGVALLIIFSLMIVAINGLSHLLGGATGKISAPIG